MKLIVHSMAIIRIARRSPLMRYECNGWQIAKNLSMENATIVNTDTYVDLPDHLIQYVVKKVFLIWIYSLLLTPQISMPVFYKMLILNHTDIDASTNLYHMEDLWIHKKHHLDKIFSVWHNYLYGEMLKIIIISRCGIITNKN